MSEQQIPLLDKKGERFQFNVPDEVTQQLHEIDMGAGGKIEMLEPVANTQTRDQYVLSSLMQEAITSSQLEGAVTIREVAKRMLQSGRPPVDRSERMILNNFLTMREITKIRAEKLSPELVFHLHRIVTEGTLDDPGAAGRLRRTDERVTVEDESGELFHYPPDAPNCRRAWK